MNINYLDIMTKDQLIDKLFDQVNNNVNMFLTIIGVFLTITLFLFGIFQWRFSSSQVKEMRNKLKKEIYEEYDLKKIDNLESQVKDLDKQTASIIQGQARKIQLILTDLFTAATKNIDENNQLVLAENLRAIKVFLLLSRYEVIEYNWLLYPINEFYKKVKTKHKPYFKDENIMLLKEIFFTVVGLGKDIDEKYITNFSAFISIASYINEEQW